MSKSAKKRAQAKARAAAHAEAEAAAAPAPAAPEPKAKAKAKAEAAPAPKAKAEPKAKAQADPAPKAKNAPKAKAKSKQQAEPAPPARKNSNDMAAHIEMDDGTGGDWEVASTLDKKQQRRQERLNAEKEAAAQKEIEEKKAAAAAKKAEENAAKAKAKAKADTKAAIAAIVSTKVTSTAAAKPAAAADPETPAEPDPNVTVAMQVPSDKIGRIIGPKGANIELIKSKTNVKTVDTQGGQVTIVGLPEDVAKAEAAVKELMAKGYMSLSFENFTEAEVSVPQGSLPNIIGSRGSVIQAIKKECQVEIDIPQVPKDAPKQQKVKVQIAGGSEGVERAKDCIASIGAHGYHEITHPGYSHAEMDVEEWKYRFIIGKGGSEMRHIQNSYKVNVTIPREDSENKKVVVVGESDDVSRAVRYIERQLESAEQPRQREEKVEKTEDDYVAQPEEEAWMSQYMYKRREHRKAL